MRTPAALILAMGFLVLFVGGGARFGIGLAFKPMVEQLGWTRSDLGLAVGVYMVVSAAATFAGGRLADRTNPKLLLALGSLIGGIGIGLMAATSRPWHAVLFYGLVFALGNGAASMAPVGVMVTRAAPQRAGLANSVAMSGIMVGQLVMVAALTLVLAASGWRSVFVWLAAAHAVLLGVLVFALPSERQEPRPAGSAADLGLAEVARSRAFWLLLGIYAICGLDDFFVATHVVALAQDKGVPALIAGNLLAAMGLCGLLGVLLAGALSDRLGAAAVTAITFALRVGVFALFIASPSPATIAIMALVFGATFLVTAPMTVLFVRDCFGTRHLGALTGLITMVHQVFGGVGAYGGALIFDRTGSYDAAFAIMLAASALALGLSLAVRPKNVLT
ncbi:MAG TPA: MFS transporter [Burkholderiales bacterium]|nr:MFS transporter [Burkholderiales bacterium]